MMDALGSFAIDREGRGMPEKLKNRPFPSISVKLRPRENAIFP